MNIENNHGQGFDPQGQPYQKSSGGGKLLKWGCGCFGVLFLMCGAGALLTYIFAGDQIVAATNMAMKYTECVAEIQTSEMISEKLGGTVNLEMDQFPEQEVDGDVITYTYDSKLSGADGQEGNMRVVFKVQGKEVTREEFTVEIDGEQIDMSGSNAMELDISDPEMGGDAVDPAGEVPAEAGSDSGS